MSLFNELSGAKFSACMRYRYQLWRQWDASKEMAVFVMLNPSTADEIDNDPTVERCQRRAIQMGFGGLRVVNIFAYRSTDPVALYQQEDPVGPENDAAILDAAKGAGLVICAWGKHGNYKGRGLQVVQMLTDAGVQSHYLQLNQDGTPKHPLYVSYDLKPVPFVNFGSDKC